MVGVAALQGVRHFVGISLRLRHRPFGQQPRVHQNVRAGVPHQGLAAQPVAVTLGVWMLHDVVQRVAPLHFALAV